MLGTPTSLPPLSMRPARSTDIPALTAIKGPGSAAVHQDRLQDAARGDLLYLMLLLAGKVIGYACLVFHRPSYWSDAGDKSRLPQIVDLTVAAGQRGRGYGTYFIRRLEGQAHQAGYTQLFVQVDPRENPGAHRLYQRLDYQPLQPEPYYATWAFLDSAGNRHHGESWILDMVTDLPGVAGKTVLFE